MGLWISAQASKTTAAVDRSPPASRCCLSRRTMFSTWVTTSSMTATRAAARPAKTMASMGTPRRESTSPAATSDKGIATTPITTARHERNHAPSATTRRAPPIAAATPRFPVDASMKASERKMEASISTPGKPCRNSSSAASTPSTTSRGSELGNLSTTSSRPGLPSTIASPISGGCSSTTLATSFRRNGLSANATSARSSGETMGWWCWIASRWLGVSIHPPVPRVDASRKLSGDTHSAPPAVSMTWSRVTPTACRCFGSTCTCSCRERWPQIATFATPGTPSSFGAIVQRANTDMSISDTSFDDSPTTIDRLAVDSGCSMTGGLETLGRAYAMVRRSCTSCRASIRSVPGSKTRRTDENPGSDLELMVLSHAVLARISSRLTVTSSSTSAAESPRASVWISTMGALNSGKTSTGASRSRETPKTISAAASTTTRERNCKLNRSTERSMTGFPDRLVASTGRGPKTNARRIVARRLGGKVPVRQL